MPAYKAYAVFLNDVEVDTVFFSVNSDVEEVRKSLIEHDGYDPNIVVELVYEDEYDEPDDNMDGDWDSAMASAGHGTDEDYGYYGE